MLTTALTAAALFTPAALAQPGNPDYFQTLQSSSIYHREYCMAPCACPSSAAQGTLSGSFTLVFDHNDAWTNYYTIPDADFTSSTNREPTVHLAGTGAFEIGGDFALTQRLVLNLVSLDEPDHPTYTFDSGTVIVHGSGFPNMSVVVQTPVMGCTQRTLTIQTTASESQPCAADVGSAGGLAGPDGELDNNDFIVFINMFFNADPIADRGQAGGQPGADGNFDNNDFIVFIDQFFTAVGSGGC